MRGFYAKTKSGDEYCYEGPNAKWYAQLYICLNWGNVDKFYPC